MAEKKTVSVTESNRKKKTTTAGGSNMPAAKATGSATPKRIGAVILWILAIALEVVAILMVGNRIIINLKYHLWFIIGAIVLDLIFVICGSLLWKSANLIDPASEKNKTKFWLWNNMGMLVAVAAFLPLIILTLTNKNADSKTKTAVGIIGAIALGIALLFGHDWNPISAEEKAAMEGTFSDSALPEGDVYITSTGTKFHLYEDCQHIKDRTKFSCKEAASEENKNIVDIAIEHGCTEVCKTCEAKFQKETGTTPAEGE
ncbi:MAG: hypothetical protein IJL03_10265 [Lachnospiraceae bacterium]|nr:hypothetical protein [Lachnospiraceae bacterium]